jgi:hypothetical protein
VLKQVPWGPFRIYPCPCRGACLSVEWGGLCEERSRLVKRLRRGAIEAADDRGSRNAFNEMHPAIPHEANHEATTPCFVLPCTLLDNSPCLDSPARRSKFPTFPRMSWRNRPRSGSPVLEVWHYHNFAAGCSGGRLRHQAGLSNSQAPGASCHLEPLDTRPLLPVTLFYFGHEQKYSLCIFSPVVKLVCNRVSLPGHVITSVYLISVYHFISTI